LQYETLIQLLMYLLRSGYKSSFAVSSMATVSLHANLNEHCYSDPDIEHLPFLAISTAFFNSLWSSYYKRTMVFNRFSAFLVSFQHKLFYILLGFGRFNLYANAYGFLWRKAFDHRRAKGGRWSWWLEVIGVVFFWCWFGAVLKGCGSWSKAITYLVVSHVVTSPLHVQARAYLQVLRVTLMTFTTDRLITFFHVYGGFGPCGIFPTPSASNYDGRHMSSCPFICAWRITSSSDTSPLPAPPTAQLA
jgi:hypothetical protein